MTQAVLTQLRVCNKIFFFISQPKILVELVKLLPVHQYSVDIFSYSGPSGILGSDVKQNIT